MSMADSTRSKVSSRNLSTAKHLMSSKTSTDQNRKTLIKQIKSGTTLKQSELMKQRAIDYDRIEPVLKSHKSGTPKQAVLLNLH